MILLFGCVMLCVLLLMCVLSCVTICVCLLCLVLSLIGCDVQSVVVCSALQMFCLRRLRFVCVDLSSGVCFVVLNV